ncbi:hypothetical protein ACWTQY_33170, partial [Klebsiella pneumoniae]
NNQLNFLMVNNYRIVQSFLTILEMLRLLTQHIRDELGSSPSWISENDLLVNNKERLIHAFSHFLPSGVSPQQTFACPGALAGGIKTLALLEQL